MSTTVTISGTNYEIPSQGQNAPWGEVLSSLLLAMTTAINTTTGPADILTSSFTLVNNQSSPADVTGASWNPSLVRSTIFAYSVYRQTTGTGATELSESGNVYLTYKSVAGVWELMRYAVGDAGITFTITTNGQLQYTSTDITGTPSVSKIVFNAKSFLQ